MATVYLWVREDGEQPKAIEKGSRPLGPGRVVEVSGVRSCDDARRTYALSRQSVDVTSDEFRALEPQARNERLTRHGQILGAQLAVREVSLG